MKRHWIPAALMGALGVGYLAGSGSGSHVQTIPQNYPTVPAEAPAPLPPPSPVDPAATPPPPEPIPDRSATDGLSEYPAWNGVDLDCSDIRHRVRVTGPDPHRLDQDGNGIGCESY